MVSQIRGSSPPRCQSWAVASSVRKSSMRSSPTSRRSPGADEVTRGLVAGILLIAVVGCGGDAPVFEAPPEEPRPNTLERITRPVDGASFHLVRLVQRGDQYAFEPAEIVIRTGDVLRFVMVGAQPESVAFDPTRASPEVARFIRAHNLHFGVLLTDAGQAYDVSFLDAPPGEYPFVSLPHGSRGMHGRVVILPLEASSPLLPS
ncbi:MAG: hypothetical protein GEU90_00175 [Gemmatimonas sp.]|nr:hypothetical protein [Gemmatimonas sp.]